MCAVTANLGLALRICFVLGAARPDLALEFGMQPSCNPLRSHSSRWHTEFRGQPQSGRKSTRPKCNVPTFWTLSSHSC